MIALSTAGDDDATPEAKWCSATQNRRYPNCSARCASSTVSRSASAGPRPDATGAKSKIDRGTDMAPLPRSAGPPTTLPPGQAHSGMWEPRNTHTP
ncbi:hypothetical protein Aglo02_61090 [Actinokineospora globicatena]|nr:hypothetical protein Aglo02_61090 [Actinokineospora globicatena]